MRNRINRFALFWGLLCFLPFPGPGPAAADDPYEGLTTQEAHWYTTDPVYRRLKDIERELEPIPHMAKLKHASRNAWNLSDEDLQKLHAYAKEAHVRGMKKWKHVEMMLNKQKVVTMTVGWRVAVQTGQLYQLGEMHKARLKEIRRREAEAYGAAYPGDTNRPHDRFGTPEHKREWEGSSEYQRFREEEREADRWLIREGEKVQEELKTGNTVVEQLIDNLRHEVLGEYRVAVEAERVIEEEIERRRTGRKRKKEEEEQLAKLRLRTNASTVELKAGETAEIWFWVEKGYPPYVVQMYEPKTKFFLDLRFDRGQPFMIPFTFSEAGRYTAQVQARDQDPETKLDPVKVRFKITEEKKKPVEEKKPGEKQKPGEEQKPGKGEEKRKPEKPEPKKASRPPIAPGTYRVHLRVPGYIDQPGSHCLPKRAHHDFEPTPFDITVDAAGNISGRCDYTCPPEKYDPKRLKRWPVNHWETRFTISGKADWKTGEVALSIPDGHVMFYSESSDNFRIGNETDYTADLKGWRVPGPLEPHLKMFYETMTARFGQADLMGFPIVAGPDGTCRMEGDGWFGRGSDGDQGGLPSCSSTVKLVRRIAFTVSNNKREEKDWTDYWRQNTTFSGKYRGKANWSLRIVGPAEEEEEGELKGELVGSLGVWPKKPRAWPPSPVRIRVGDVLEIEARGVFSTNYWKTKDLTRKATWRAKGGLQKLGKGRYRAMEPGTAYVRAGVKTGGEWSSGTVKVIVLPALKKQK